MSLSVKRSAEIVIVGTRRSADADIIFKTDGLTREAVIRIVILQTVTELVPIFLVFYHILALHRNYVLRVSVYVAGIVLIII